jgi:hypothetical protein
VRLAMAGERGIKCEIKTAHRCTVCGFLSLSYKKNVF